jgi:restriction system protein
MALPTYEEFMLPTLVVLSDQKEKVNKEILNEVALSTHLSEEEMRILLPSGSQHTYINRIYWAMVYLKKAGLIISPKRATYKITKAGLELLKSKPEKINCDLLYKYDSFIDFKSGKNSKHVEEKQQHSETDITPQEQIDYAYKQITNALSSELLELLKKIDPSFFEIVVVDLLLAMGYGGSKNDAGKVVGKSGDGGIDGIIDQDKLGLDKIYIQAKRWQGNVGSKELNSFVGSLVGFHADKGVFITTSDFTKDAYEYISKAGKNIILINGQKLVELMIEHNIGVSENERFVIKKVDHDYFSDEDI